MRAFEDKMRQGASEGEILFIKAVFYAGGGAYILIDGASRFVIKLTEIAEHSN